LQPGSRNLIVYGANGSGKSSFVDAIEYILSDERIEHLAHEYSGHKQLLGVRNTDTPEKTPSAIRLKFDNNSALSVKIPPDGDIEYEAHPSGLLQEVRKWDLMRTVLRQDKVADFIHRTKGQKYAELLPLLGLQAYETTAENIRKLKNEIEDQATASFAPEVTRKELVENALAKLGTVEPVEVIKQLEAIAQRYSVALDQPLAVGEAALSLESELNAKVKVLAPTQQRHMILNQILDENLDAKRQKLKEASAQVFDALGHQIEVLVQTEKLVHNADPLQEVACPACGRSITVEQLATHVRTELDRLHELKEKRDKAQASVVEYTDTVNRIIHALKNEHLNDWLNESDNVDALTALKHLETRMSSLGDVITPEKIDDEIDTILRSVKRSVEETPLPTKQLLDDLGIIEAAKSLKGIEELSRFLSSIHNVTSQLEAGEEIVRHYVRTRVEEIVSRCTSAIQKFWSILHPSEPIEDLRLTSSEDKAVEVELKFFGKPQPSPRLTLSEGHRNSLSLCIFLAVAELAPVSDVPIILDDIVSSLDRDHRGRIVEILQRELGNRQILLFTHDREWYSELRSRLPSSKWSSCTLKPWIKPSTGIQFSQSRETFDDARSMVTLRPESAGNMVRSIMDYQCAIAAEALKIPLEFRRGDENDRRSCVEFLDNICSDGRRRLRRSSGESCDDILSAWNTANSLLKTWANRASHTGSLVGEEAKALIDACEIAVKKFHCENCNDPIWIAYVKNKRVQCSCGKLLWVLD
jgi:energy-coupling factor transporter ATP-binding protein EcfA2